MNRNGSVVLVAGLGGSRRQLIALLEGNGYETLEAGDGFEALQTAIDRAVDVLIAEEEMPGLTGRELIGIVQKHRAIGRCLLISDATDQTREGYTEYMEGKASYLVVPFEPEQLLGKIREVFPAAVLERV